jgi:hypothetical protein
LNEPSSPSKGKPREPGKLTREQQLCEDVAGFQLDPLGYVMYAFPWGVKGTPLENRKRPRKWQEKMLRDLGDRLRTTVTEKRYEVLREAIVSGHGVGKSALFAMLVMFSLSTMEFARGLVTANTEEQLRGKTWPEVQKWHSMAVNKHWFTPTATAIFHCNPEYQKRWRFDCVTWSENNTEAFAGLHNEGYRIVLMFDEASSIPPKIWEVAEGATTDENTEIIWCVAGNPTRPIGRFKDCFNKLRHRWNRTHVDAREVEGTNKELHAQWERDYGVDSDFFKVRVRGEFPSASPMQLIPEEWIQRARRPYVGDGSLPQNLVSADVADGGVDLSVITSAKQYATHLHVTSQKSYNFEASVSPIKVAQAVLRTYEFVGGSAEKGDTCIIDALGVGAGTAGYIMEQEIPCIAYKGGAGSANPEKWRNRRVQAYMNVRDMLREERLTFDPAAFESEADWDDFVEQMCSIMKAPANDKLEDLVTKEQMKRDGVKSPDRADSVAMLTASKVPQMRPASADAPPSVVVVRSTINAGLEGL